MSVVRHAPAWLLALGLLAALGTLPEARGHGGQFRGPGGGTPPGGRGLPPSPGPVPQIITPGETWQTWWDLNRLNLLPGRDDMLRGGPVTPSEDGAAIDPYTGWEARRQVAARQQVVPFLLKVLDPKVDTRDEIRAAALIALGKISTEGAARTLFVHYLRDGEQSALVRESAALAIGLLCRSRPGQQLTAPVLDGLRSELLRAAEDPDLEVRVRGFAVLSLGLLGDQPSTELEGEDGGRVVRALWKILPSGPRGADLPVAILTAIGLQPPRSVPVAVLDGLRAMLLGKRRPGPKWNAPQRSHAVTALARLGVPGVDAMLVQVMRAKRMDQEIRRAAYLGAAHRAPLVDGPTRVRLARGVAKGMGDRRDPLTVGLGLVAAGRLLGADLEASDVAVLEATSIPKLLFTTAERGVGAERGYAALGLALAARGARASGAALPFLARAKARMLNGLAKGRGDDTIRAVYAVGLGLLRAEEGIEPLLAVVEDRGALPAFRGYAAVALAEIGRRRDEVRAALRALMGDKHDVLLRLHAALGLALLGDRDVCGQLLDELEKARSEYQRSHIVIALGRLGDLGSVQRLMDYVRSDDRSELARALGVVALGMILDPEPRPSLTKLRQDANFPAATPVLYSAFAIF
jgi:HEAT repeat protein